MSELIGYLPEYYLASAEMCALQAAIQPEIDLIWAARNDLLTQLNPNTATWSLDLWEAAFGLNTSVAQSTDERRAAVKSKIIGRSTFNLDLARSAARTITGYDAEIIEDAKNYTVGFAFVGSEPAFVDIPLDTLSASLGPMLPAHLVLDLNPYPITWGDLADTQLTWQEIPEKVGQTWGEIQNKTIVRAKGT